MRKEYNTPLKSDSELIFLYKETQSLEVLGDLYKRHMHLVYGTCLKILKNADDSKDAVSTIFEKLIQDVLRFTIDNFKSWLYVLTKRFCLMQLRAKNSVEKKKDDYSYLSFMESTIDVHPIDEDTENTNLKICISKLKEIQKQSVRLFYYEELSYKEISDTINQSEKKVKSYIQNAKRNLKICLQKLKMLIDE